MCGGCRVGEGEGRMRIAVCEWCLLGGHVSFHFCGKLCKLFVNGGLWRGSAEYERVRNEKLKLSICSVRC